MNKRFCLAIAFLLFSFVSRGEDSELRNDNQEIVFNKFLLKQALKLTQKGIPLEPPAAAPSEATIDLRNPKYRSGILYTDEGGVIQNEEMRIQAKSIQYIKRKEEGKSIQRIEAEGNLLIQFRGKAYVGDELEYDLLTKTGTVYKGRTYAAPFYIGGEAIHLHADGSYKVDNAYVTSCENIDSTWDLHAASVTIKEERLEAKKVRFRFFSFPFWLPSFKMSLKKFTRQPIIRYKLTWDKGSGPKATIRYQVYSWKDFTFYLRGEYRLRKGFGGALETEYIPQHGRTTFFTRSYLASDVIPTNIVKKQRYRLQGEFHSVSPTGNTSTDLTWDKFSDVLMPGDFKSEDFELNTAKKTQLTVYHHQNDLIAILFARPRFNTFETIKQELPTAFGTIRPLQLRRSKIITENWSKASYLDLAYSDHLTMNLRDFHAIRLETHNEIYRPIHMGDFLVTPHLGIVGIYYSNNPEKQSIGFGLIKYGFAAKCEVNRLFSHHKHVVQPYMQFDGYSPPTTNVDNHFIFSIQDGYNRQNLFRAGVRNLVFSRRANRSSPTFFADLYANAFFGPSKIPVFVQKMYLTMHWSLPSLAFLSTNAWNFQYRTVDFANLRGDWTVSEDVALSLEVRYRSRFDWRKSDHENFFLDITRSQEELLTSPLSDRRVTILTHMYFRLSPFWSAHIQSHHGFLRLNQTPYNEFKIDLFTWLSASWKIRITYQHTQRDDRVSAGFELIRR